jgi:uncharacterized protein (DUF2141 family)
MVRPSKEKAKIILVLLIAVLFNQCANQLPPGGGDIDTTPPRITEVYPEDTSVNYDEDYFEITFSEYVDKRSVREAIFISPAVDGNIELNWSGRSVRVKFPQKLRENTTYNITIGTDVVDLNNRNNMASAFDFSFSTGEQLDRRVITGNIHSEKPQGIFLFAYLNPADTLNPSAIKPEYISQSGTDGSYRFRGLAAGTYRIFAVQDEFRDLVFNQEQDRIGIPFKEVLLEETDSLFTGLDFFIFQIDTVKPRLLTSVMTDKNHVVLSFSEELDSSSVSSKNFSLYDSTAGVQIEPLYAYKNRSKPVEVFLAVKNSISETNMVYIFADTLKDLFGNIYLSEQNSVTVSTREDTTKPFITRSHPPSGNTIADFQNQVFSFSFNDGVDSNIVKNNTTMTDTSGKPVKYNIFFTDDASFRIFPAEILTPSKDYYITFNLNAVADAAGNRADTSYQYRFRTISGLDFTGVAGSLLNAELNRNPVLVLEGIDEKRITYQQNAGSSTFTFRRIEPGTYRLWAFYDEDSSNAYTRGMHYPFVPSEEFKFYSDSLLLRPRWAITDVVFNLGRNIE